MATMSAAIIKRQANIERMLADALLRLEKLEGELRCNDNEKRTSARAGS